MSEFLMVVPVNWTEVTTDWIVVSTTPEEVQFWLAQEAWEDIENIFAPRGEVPPGKHVVNARMIQIENGYRMWVLFE